MASASSNNAVFVFERVGDGIQVTNDPSELSGAGFLPESSAGPYLALSEDGSVAAWRCEGVTREAFVQAVPEPVAHVPGVECPDAGKK